MAGIDREAFFARVRASLFEGVLTALQASGLSALLDEWAAAHAGHDDHEPAGHGHLTPGGPPAF